MGRKEGFLERDLFGEKMEIGHEGDDTSAEEAVMESIASFVFSRRRWVLVFGENELPLQLSPKGRFIWKTDEVNLFLWHVFTS